MGFLKGKCDHCGNVFFFKITITGINVDVLQEIPEGTPCVTLEEAKPTVTFRGEIETTDGPDSAI
jgi:hypothetical protein